MNQGTEQQAGGRGLRNVGIFAHVDAGKTTTTEQMLYRSGRIRTPGSVDDGTAQTDWMDVERERGISVRAAVTRYGWKGTDVNLVDTPGHVDFLSEVERSLRVMDGAVLVVSAVEGVQAQTEVVWQALRALGIPTLIYINKLDRVGADGLRTLEEVRRTLSPLAVPVQAPRGAEERFAGSADLLGITEAEGEAEGGVTPYLDLLAEAAAEREEALLQRYLEEGGLSPSEMRPVIAGAARRGELFPVLFGASARGIGIAELLDAVGELLPPPASPADEGLSGVVFKLDKDPAMGRIAYVRLYSGTLRNRDTVNNHTRGLQEKVTQIRRIEGQRTEDMGGAHRRGHCRRLRPRPRPDRRHPGGAGPRARRAAAGRSAADRAGALGKRSGIPGGGGRVPGAGGRGSAARSAVDSGEPRAPRAGDGADPDGGAHPSASQPVRPAGHLRAAVGYLQGDAGLRGRGLRRLHDAEAVLGRAALLHRAGREGKRAAVQVARPRGTAA
ncbi:GTP-binding protein [Paenibacillus mucilaginosus]|uniref:GTP-binding protein n=1 Tax=Paenibacillus mucilaginosus TaxID=61624 RepID=UPI00031E2D52